MKKTHRFVNWSEAINFLTTEFNWTRRDSIHFVRDNQFTVGTDRATWLTLPESTVSVTL